MILLSMQVVLSLVPAIVVFAGPPIIFSQWSNPVQRSEVYVHSLMISVFFPVALLFALCFVFGRNHCGSGPVGKKRKIFWLSAVIALCPLVPLAAAVGCWLVATFMFRSEFLGLLSIFSFPVAWFVALPLVWNLSMSLVESGGGEGKRFGR
jgi:hypothetical protein